MKTQLSELLELVEKSVNDCICSITQPHRGVQENTRQILDSPRKQLKAQAQSGPVGENPDRVLPPTDLCFKHSC